MNKPFGNLKVESKGKVIWAKKYRGKSTMTEALNYIDSLGLSAVQYCLCANGERIILAMYEDEY